MRTFNEWDQWLLVEAEFSTDGNPTEIYRNPYYAVDLFLEWRRYDGDRRAHAHAVVVDAQDERVLFSQCFRDYLEIPELVEAENRTYMLSTRAAVLSEISEALEQPAKIPAGALN